MKKFYTVFSLLFLFILANYSCTKIDTTTLGTDLIPTVDNVSTFDTILNVITGNDYMVDSTRITYSEDHALGTINDPAFGSTKAEIYFAVSPGFFGTHPFVSKDSVVKIDSVVLQLAYKGAYGDTLAQESFSTKEIDPAVNFAPSLIGYRIDTLRSGGFNTIGSLGPDHFQLVSELTKEKLVIRKPGDTVRISNVMRIRLDNSLGNRLKNYDTSNAYKSDSLFRTYFRGLAIKNASASAPGALVYFNLNSADTKLIVYYQSKKLGGAGALDSTSASFTLSPYVNANLVARTPAGGYLANVGNNNPNNPFLYIQSAPGSYASIRIPGLSGLSNRVVHRAELIVERENSSVPGNPPFTVPQAVFVDAIDSANSNRIITIPHDFLAQSGTYNFAEFGGFLRSDDTYRYTLTRYVQGIVTRHEPAYTLRLHAAFFINPYYKDPVYGMVPYAIQLSNKIAYGRLVVKSGSYPDPQKKMRLRIIYSKI